MWCLPGVQACLFQRLPCKVARWLARQANRTHLPKEMRPPLPSNKVSGALHACLERLRQVIVVSVNRGHDDQKEVICQCAGDRDKRPVSEDPRPEE